MVAKRARSKYSEVYFGEQYLVDLDLRALKAKKMNESYTGVETKNIYEGLCLCFIPID